MMTEVMERDLSAHESTMALGDMRVVTVWEVHGDLDEGALQAALSRLVAHHPVLGGRFVFTGGRVGLRVGEEARPPVRLHRVPELGPELSVRCDWADGPLLRMALITQGRTHHLVTTMPRACMDGMSGIALLGTFWSMYTAECTGQPYETPVRPALPSPIEDRILPVYLPDGLREYVEQRARADAAAPPGRLPCPRAAGDGPGADMTFGVTRVSIDPATTSALAAIALRDGVSINSLVCGVFAAAVRSSLEPSTGEVQVGVGVAVDLRRRMTPPIPPGVVQSAASGFQVGIAVGPAADPAALARELAVSIGENLDARTAERELAAFPHMVEQFPPTCTVTNLGTIPEPRLPANQVITGVQLLPMTRIPMLFVVVSRFGGSIHLDLTFSRAWYTDAQMEGIAADTRRALERTLALHDSTPREPAGSGELV